MSMNRFLFALVVCLFVTGAGCSKHDKDFIPYSLTGLHVYLYDEKKAPNGDYFAGSIKCSYRDREGGLSRARALAYQEAARLHFDTSHGRYYIICTETTNNDCVTKVR